MLRARPVAAPDGVPDADRGRRGDAERHHEGQTGELHDNGYWLLPYLTFQADCPYLVGSYAEIGTKLKEFAEKGLTTIMLDMVADETEMQHVCKALKASGLF